MQTSNTIARVLAVLHLSLIFFYILWILSIPFFQGYFEIQKRNWATAYIENSSHTLSPAQKMDLQNTKAVTELLYKRTLWQKSLESLSLLALQMPLLYWIWMIASIKACVGILKQSQRCISWALGLFFLAALISLQTLSHKAPLPLLYTGDALETTLNALKGLAKFPKVHLLASHTPMQSGVFLLWHALILAYANKQRRQELKALR